MAPYYVQSLFVFFAVFSLMGGLVSALYFSRLDSSARYWVVAALLSGVTAMATVFRNDLPPLWSYSIPIGLSGTSAVLMGLGIARLHNKGPQWRSLLVLGLGTGAFIATMEWARVEAAPELPLLLSGSLFGLTSVWGAYCAHVHYKISSNPFSMHMRWVMVVLGLAHLLRLQAAVTGWGLNTFGPEAWTYGIWTVVFVMGMLRYFAYIAMRIHEQAQSQLAVASALAREEEGRRFGGLLARQDRQHSLGVMSASFAHELNQPLATILSYAELLQHQQKTNTADTQLTARALDGIVAGSVRAGEIIRRIRNFIQPTALRKELLDVRGVIQEVLSLVEPETLRSNIELTKPIMPNDPVWVLGDAVQLSQVLFNLMRNAIESVQKGEDRRIYLVLRTENQERLIEVHDTGLGLSEVAAQQAGDPFYTTKIAGLGLGLSISKTILAQFDGRLTLSNTDYGACACIRLPLVDVA